MQPILLPEPNAFSMTILRMLAGGICCICLVQSLQAQNTGKAGKKNPLVITGSIGAAANFYSSSDSFYTRPRYAWNAYGGFTARLKSFSMPVSFVVNKYDQSRVSTFSQVGISPTYKWIRLHLGYRSIPFSPLTYDGQSFRGVGMELKPRGFHLAAFYGTFTRPPSGRDTTRVFRDSNNLYKSFYLPQYNRKAYGVKVGVGNSTNFFDLIYFHAKDDRSSASFQDTSRAIYGSQFNWLTAQENTVISTAFRIKFLKRLALSGDIAVSGLKGSLGASSSIKIDSANPHKQLAELVFKVLPSNQSSVASFAGQSSLSFHSAAFTSAVNYRNVQPGFRSLGAPYILNDVEQVSWLNSLTAVKGRLTGSTILTYQHNNLNRKLNTELQTLIGTANLNAYISQHVNLNANYAGYRLNQAKSNARLTQGVKLLDSFLLRQYISQYTLTPSYNLIKGSGTHFISASINVSMLSDKNVSTAPFTNGTNVSSSLNYTRGWVSKPYSFSFTGLYNQYEQKVSTYASYGFTVGASLQALHNRNLNLQGTAGYLFNRYLSAGNESNTRNLTYSVNAAYYARHHSFNLFANYVFIPPNNIIQQAINKAVPYTVAYNSLYSGASYSYSF